MIRTVRRAFLQSGAAAVSISSFALFTAPADAAALLKTTSAQEPIAIEQKFKADKTLKRKRLVNVDAAALSSAILPASAGRAADRAQISARLAGQVELPLFNDVEVILKMKSVDPAFGGGVAWTASAGGKDYGILVVNNGKITGSIEAGGKSFLIEPTGRGDEHRVLEVDSEAYPNDVHAEISAAPKSGKGGSGGTATTGGTTGTATTTAPIPTLAAPAEIKILAAYTSQAATALGSAPASKIALDVAIANTGFLNSGVPIKLTLVGVTPVSTTYNEKASTDSVQPLRDITSGTAYNFAAIRNMRTSLGADLVTMYAARSEYCGVAWVNTSSSSSYGFSVINPACAGTPSLAHELGHNMALRHDRHVEAAAGTDVYNYGYVNTAGRFRDIMSYNNACAALGFTCPRITYYSSSKLTYNGYKLGLPQGTAGAADAARKLTEQAPKVAVFR